MAGAVANPLYMGYRSLYRTILEDAKRGLAKALRLFTRPESFPILVHCIHGKDRTGLVVMLLLLLCGVPKEVRDPKSSKGDPDFHAWLHVRQICPYLLHKTGLWMYSHGNGGGHKWQVLAFAPSFGQCLSCICTDTVLNFQSCTSLQTHPFHGHLTGPK